MIYATVFLSDSTEVNATSAGRTMSVRLGDVTLHGPPDVVRKVLTAAVDAATKVATT